MVMVVGACGCGPKAPGEDSEGGSGSAGTDPAPPTGEAPTSTMPPPSTATTTTATATGSDESTSEDEGPGPCDQTTGDPTCDTCSPLLFSAKPYALTTASVHGTCALVSATAQAEAMDVVLDCAGEEVHVVIAQIDVMPDFTPFVGAEVEVDLERTVDDGITPRRDWVALRHEGRVVYAAVNGSSLIPPGAGPGVYAPLTVQRSSVVLCAPSPTGQLPSDGDGFGCELATLTALEFAVDGESPAILFDNQGDFIPAPGGDLRVQVRRSIEGEKCFPDAPPGPVGYFTFSITLVAE
jgi:hypothetical protein